MRQSNIELCRIISIVFVLLVHSAFAVNGFPEELNKNTLWLIFLESISIVGVNVFIFISGYFSIKLKPRTIYTLILTCLFYYIILTIGEIIFNNTFTVKNILFVSNSHYFIVDYLGLAILSPILNKFAEHINKKEFGTILIALIIYQTYFAYITNAASSEFDGGYSLVSYSIIYLIARYIRTYGVNNLIQRYSGTLYLLCTTTIIILTILLLYLGFPQVIYKLYYYNNPIVILQSIFFFCFFEKMSIPNNRLINHIAKSTLGILLFHASLPATATVWRFMKHIFSFLADNINFINICYWVICILLITVSSIIIDQIRLLLLDYFFKTTKK